MARRARMDRLTLRLAVGITALVVVFLAIGLYALSSLHFNQTLDARRRAADLQNRILETTLRHAMLNQDTRLISDVLAQIAREPEVMTALIVDHDGVVRFSSLQKQVGQKESKSSPTCMVCHAKPPEERALWTLLDLTEGEILRTVRPIENREECHKCHDASKRMNGMLVLDISLQEVDAQLRRDAIWMAAATVALAILLVASIGFLVRRLILRRLARLGETARAITAGRLEERVPVEGDDTITRLSADLNNMADATVGLITEVRAHDAQLANVMNSLDDGLIVLDRNFRVVASNQAFCRRVGVLPEALRGQCCRDVIGTRHPCGLATGKCPTVLCLATGEVQRATYHLASPDGKGGRVEEVHASPVFDDDGNATQVVEIWRDITDRVEEETRLAEFERLESLGVLASGFSHEMNTPLASTLTCAEAILGRIEEARAAGGPNGTGEVREYAETIRHEVLRCRKITEQFLRFARGIPPTVEPVDLQQVLESVMPLVGPAARQSGVTVHTEAGDRPVIVRANTEAVQHVLLNLLVNAIQAFDTPVGQTGQAGRLPHVEQAGSTSHVEQASRLPEVAQTSACPTPGRRIDVRLCLGEDVRVRVQDNGPGVPAETRKHLFEPFRTGRRQGTGIGLFLSRRFMRRFGGDIVLVEGEVGGGACFEIVFASEESVVPLPPKGGG